MNLFFVSLLILFFGGLVTFAIPNNRRVRTSAVFSLIAAVLMTVFIFPVLRGGSALMFSIVLNFPFAETAFKIDFISAFFILIISWLSVIGIIYAEGYLRHYVNKGRSLAAHLLFFSVFACSMILVVSAGSVFFFLFVWEIMSLSSFFLLMFDAEKREVISAGIKYLIAMHVGFLFLVCGFFILYVKSGSPDFSTFADVLSSDKSTARLVFILFFIGFGIKAGFVPFHMWLPSAHPAAPSHISGLMSGVMIKTGIYGILRILDFIGTPTLSMAYIVILISLFSALWGIFYSVSQRDIKRVLAYSSSENIGIIGLGIGIGMLGMIFKNSFLITAGLSGACMHVLNHAIFKNLLFYGAGTVYQIAGTRDMEKMGGLIKALPYTGVAMLFGCVAVCGLPPLNGFSGEFLIYMSGMEGLSGGNRLLILTLVAAMTVLALVGAVAVLNFTRLYSIVFLGEPRKDKPQQKSEPEFYSVFSLLLLALLTLVFGILPHHVFSFIQRCSLVFAPVDPAVSIRLYTILNNISIVFISFIAICVAVYLARKFLISGKKIDRYRTWDCGYGNYNPRMQYTGFSFSSMFLGLVKPFVRPVYGFNTGTAFMDFIFPRLGSFQEKVEDLFDVYLVKPVTKLVFNFLKLFSVIQTGYTQQYILYGLFFMLIMFLLLITGVF